MEYWHTQVQTRERTNLLRQFQCWFFPYINPKFKVCSLRRALIHTFFYSFLLIFLTHLILFYTQGNYTVNSNSPPQFNMRHKSMPVLVFPVYKTEIYSIFSTYGIRTYIFYSFLLIFLTYLILFYTQGNYTVNSDTVEHLIHRLAICSSESIVDEGIQWPRKI